MVCGAREGHAVERADVVNRWGTAVLAAVRKLPPGTVISGRDLECRHAWRLAKMVNGDLARRCRTCGRLEALNNAQWREVKGGD